MLGPITYCFIVLSTKNLKVDFILPLCGIFVVTLSSYVYTYSNTVANSEPVCVYVYPYL